MKKKILICGATGFIGRNIAEHFADKEGIELYGTYNNSLPLSNSKINMFKADLRDAKDVEKAVADKDVVIQAAATTSGVKDAFLNPSYHVTDNAIMNSLIFKSCVENKISHVIAFSCSVMYQSSEVPVKERDFNANDEIHPKYFGAAWTKIYMEKICEYYSRMGDTKFTAIRHSNIYGPNDKYDLERSHVFGASMAKVMAADNGGKLLVWGSGEEKRDLLYISDLIDFVELAIIKQNSRFELLNVGSGTAVSVTDLVNRIIRISGKNLSVDYDPEKPTIKTKLSLDCAKARKMFDWSPRVPLEEGILRTIKWYETNIMNNGNLIEKRSNNEK